MVDLPFAANPLKTRWRLTRLLPQTLMAVESMKLMPGDVATTVGHEVGKQRHGHTTHALNETVVAGET